MISKWEIYFCALDPSQDLEQQSGRPVLVVSSDAVNYALPVATILPLSPVAADSHIYPTEVFLDADATSLSKDAVAMVQQVCTVSQVRFTDYIGTLTSPLLQKQILDALKSYFEI